MSYLGVGTVSRCEIMSHSSVGWNIVISQPAPTSLRWDIVTWDTGIRGMSSTDEKGTKLNKVLGRIIFQSLINHVKNLQVLAFCHHMS